MRLFPASVWALANGVRIFCSCGVKSTMRRVRSALADHRSPPLPLRFILLLSQLSIVQARIRW